MSKRTPDNWFNLYRLLRSVPGPRPRKLTRNAGPNQEIITEEPPGGGDAIIVISRGHRRKVYLPDGEVH